ncbi:CocE/NonD family hydrolase [Streptomyces sp. LaPpAH-108]|uniref:CocE/NonD family hydrolase n=1 Tax=Streptomyces sp. LaPpAH-108 TaxID=1155714 RepID=UPI000380906B|nr:CocE/NonD family hydrolase [Streptomyces sp. LaPpAH-108]
MTSATARAARPAGARPPLPARLLRATFRGLPAKRHPVGYDPALPVPAADGGPLLTDHYFPRAEGDFPTLLIRSPYGRGLPWSAMYGLLLAEQGFHVVVQSCRGTGGSGGTFDLWRNEPADGQAAVAWLRQQPWFDGRLGTVGPSYLGYTQWALALDPPPELKAMVIQVGLHDPYALFHTDGALHLENALTCGAGIAYQHRGALAFLRATLRLKRRLRDITTARPLRGAYRPALGELPWLDDVMTNPDPNDSYWTGASLAPAADRLRVPTALVTGWHDALADQTFAQYARLRRAGCETALLVGPWTHASALQRGWPEVFTESLAWLRAHLCGDRSGLRPTGVRVHLGGTWRDVDQWPPEAGAEPGAESAPVPEPIAWYPLPGAHLTHQPPVDNSPVASFRYDPDDPTPSLGGPLLSPGAGPRDNRSLEARADVLTFTGPPLTEPLDILGPVTARIGVSTDTGHADVFTRLCDVDPEGRSVNVCDGLGRARTTGDAPARLTVPMGTTAHRFPAGHRVRWQLSGGAHPRYARSPGTGELPADATEFVPARITLHADSALTLPRYQSPRSDNPG